MIEQPHEVKVMQKAASLYAVYYHAVETLVRIYVRAKLTAWLMGPGDPLAALPI